MNTSSYFPPDLFRDKRRDVAPEKLTPEDLHLISVCEAIHEAIVAGGLVNLEEPPLFPPSAHSPLTLRFLVVPTWGGPSVIRLEQHQETWQILAKVAEARDIVTRTNGPIVRAMQGRLTADEVIRFDQFWERCSLWEEPTFIDEPPMMDGSTYLVELVQGARYHIIYRGLLALPPYAEVGSPDFAKFCQFLAGIGGMDLCH